VSTPDAADALHFVSADSHVLEPGDLWTTHAATRYRERVLRVETEDGRSRRVGEDLGYLSLTMTFAAGERGDSYQKGVSTWEERPASGYDATARLAAIEQDGVVGEVLYPTLGLGLYEIRDPGLLHESTRVYNEWLAELVASGGGRFLGVGMISLGDPEHAADEIEEIASLGLRGALLPVTTAVPYNDPLYTPLWEAAAALSVPLSFHVGTGGDLTRVQGPGAGGVNLLSLHYDVQIACQLLIWSGVFDRHPELRVLFVEIGIGWVAHLLALMDDKWDQHRSWMRPSLERLPSEYFRANCAATFERDEVGLLTREWVGAQSFMWATDYPHIESSWPHSREIGEKELAPLEPTERALIAAGNVENAYDWSPRA
jgi:predicted TIM-barrel fold metal-dependent hydrolase